MFSSTHKINIIWCDCVTLLSTQWQTSLLIWRKTDNRITRFATFSLIEKTIHHKRQNQFLMPWVRFFFFRFIHKRYPLPCTNSSAVFEIVTSENIIAGYVQNLRHVSIRIILKTHIYSPFVITVNAFLFIFFFMSKYQCIVSSLFMNVVQ